MGTQKESQVINLKPNEPHIMHYNIEYDSTKPYETLKSFIGDVKGMLTKYEFNRSRLVEIEAEMCDILHYIEISPNKNVPEGYKLYKKMAELRRERRVCKNENDLLQPIYEHFHATEVLNKLSLVQGECAKARSAIDLRLYSTRTDVLKGWMINEEAYGPGGISTEQFYGKSFYCGEEEAK